MEKQLICAAMLYLVCANLCTTNRFSYKLEELLKENVFVRNIEKLKMAMIIYYTIKLITWQDKMDTGG